MITLTAKINLINKTNISGISGEATANNISAPLSSVLNDSKRATSPFILGASILGGGDKFSGGVDYFISSTPSNENGYFETPFEFSVDFDSAVSSLTIAFDTKNNRYPNTVIIDEKMYAPNDPILTVVDLPNSVSHRITISNWNAPKFPLVITGIYSGNSIDIDRRNLLSLNIPMFDRADTKVPSYGIISNRGNISFNDLDGEVGDFANLGVLKEGAEIKVSLNNTLYKHSEEVASMVTGEWNYDNNSREVSVQLNDRLVLWQDIEFSGIKLDANNIQITGLDEIYKKLYNKTPKEFNMLSFDELDYDTQMMLKTVVKYPIIRKGALWQAWNNLALAAFCHIYINTKGRTVFRYNGLN